MKLIVYLLSFFVFLSFSTFATSDYPKSKEQRQYDAMGSIVGKKGLVFRPQKLFNQVPDSTGNKISAKKEFVNQKNQSLWQAALEEIEYMPLASINSDEGIIITDWYSLKDKLSYSYKVRIQVLNGSTVNDNLKVLVYERSLIKGEWINNPLNNNLILANHLKDRIIARAQKLAKR